MGNYSTRKGWGLLPEWVRSMIDIGLVSPSTGNSLPTVPATTKLANLPARPRDVFDEPVLKELLDLFAHEQGVLRQAALKAIIKGW
jgi:hypothetical protein